MEALFEQLRRLRLLLVELRPLELAACWLLLAAKWALGASVAHWLAAQWVLLLHLSRWVAACWLRVALVQLVQPVPQAVA